MLHSISWQQFILAFGFLVTAYYCIAFLSTYHREILAFVKRQPLPKENTPQITSPTIVGKTKVPDSDSLNVPREQTIAIDDLIVASDKGIADQIAITSVGSETRNLAPLKDDLTTLIKIKSGKPKEELIPLIQLLFSRYAPILTSQEKDSSSTFLKDLLLKHYDQEIPIEEINSWWIDQLTQP